MMQFNPDGSLKLSQGTLQKRQQDVDRMNNTRCLHVKKEMVNFSAPKKCLLRIRLSDRVTDNRFIETTWRYFKEKAETPIKVIKLNDKEFDIEIGTSFRRCTECCSLISQYKEFMDGSLIEDKGNCTFEGFRKNFSYEDYFDD